jgi:hypothetical protein
LPICPAPTTPTLLIAMALPSDLFWGTICLQWANVQGGSFLKHCSNSQVYPFGKVWGRLSSAVSENWWEP